MARIARWDRPLGGPVDRAKAWAHMLFADHGIFRLVYANRARVTGELWRSSQPSPGQIARFAREGVRTVVNLRGGREHGSWPLERDACLRHGLTLVDLVLRSREAPSREALHEAARLFETLDYPAMVHCKSGADRAGLFAALYLILRHGKRVAEARGQLSPAYGHFRHAKTGILDAFLDAFERDGEARSLSLLEWTEQVYDPETLARGFRTRMWSTLLADRLIRRE